MLADKDIRGVIDAVQARVDRWHVGGAARSARRDRRRRHRFATARGRRDRRRRSVRIDSIEAAYQCAAR